MSSPAKLPAALPATTRGPFFLAMAMVVVTTVTILWGAMTTSTGSGLAFADWPLSDGTVMPERSLSTVPGFLEHFHRMFGAIAGVLSLSLALWLQLGRRSDRLARRTAWMGLALIIVQGVIGGVGVLNGLPTLMSVTHGTLAQITLATFAWSAYQLSRKYASTEPLSSVPPGSGRKLAVTGVMILIVQTVIGGIARHTNSSHALWTHVGNAFVVFLIVVISTGFAVGRLGKIPGLRSTGRWLSTLMIVQIILGFITLLIRNDAGKTPENVANLATAAVISVHVLFGALLTVLASLLCAQVFRGTRHEAR